MTPDQQPPSGPVANPPPVDEPEGDAPLTSEIVREQIDAIRARNRRGKNRYPFLVYRDIVAGVLDMVVDAHDALAGRQSDDPAHSDGSSRG